MKLKPLTVLGPAVVSLDHVVKDPEKRVGDAIGAIQERFGLTGDVGHRGTPRRR